MPLSQVFNCCFCPKVRDVHPRIEIPQHLRPAPRPNGANAAVIPRWFAELSRGEAPIINAEGLSSTDFCHVANAVQANLLAATTANQAAENTVFNVACGKRATLLELLSKGFVISRP